MSGAPAPQLQINGGAVRIETAAPKPDLSGLVNVLQLLLKVERDARQAKTLDELWFLTANETRRALQARQIFVLERTSHGCQMMAISSLSKVDRDSPTVRWLEKLGDEMVAALADKPLIQAPIANLAAATDDAARVFPFPHAMLAPLAIAECKPVAYLLAVREAPFGESEIAAVERLGDAIGHAAMALGGHKRQKRRYIGKKLAVIISLLTIAALAFVPVSMTVLAPAEVVARDSFLVTAPVEGIIDHVVVEPNQEVKAGDVVIKLADTMARNQLEIAEQEVAVAEAKWRQISLASFNDPAARRELTVVTSERALKRAERDYARDLLARTLIRTERDGVAIYADKRELIGRPVQTGQRLMEIADPTKIRIRAQAPLDDAMALKPGAKLKLFPDADPLNPVTARVTDASHQARATESGGLAFRVDADIPAEELERLRIGHRGTAQIFGENVSLGFYLFRRPISAIRQKFGL